MPSTAALVKEAIGNTTAAAFDIAAACSGFVFAYATADSYVRSGMARNVLVIGAELLTRFVDYSDRSTCILFGDGAGAVVVERIDDDRVGLIDHVHHIDGVGAKFLHQSGGGSLHPATHQTVDDKLHFVHQEGREVYKYAVKGMASVTQEILDKNGIQGSDVKLFVAHQANLRIIEHVARRVGLAEEQVAVTIHRFGNTTSATIPSALHIYQEKGVLEPGDLVVLCAFGAGFTWGATLLRWTAGA
jgi:3-oxoacyl-[acyl-carrier-protein] synthase-3